MRATVDSIVEKRKAGNCRVLLTGGTGFTGSFLAVELLKKGYTVVFLSRPTGKSSASDRVEQVLGWHGYTGRNYEVVGGQIAEPRLGLDDERYARLLETIDEIWHCAAETAFSERGRKQSEAVNVKGTLNVLKLAAEGKCRFFHFMSTAYVAGKRDGACREDFETQAEFHNVYEETKYKAERSVIETCREKGIPANIYRPSIIYGDSKSGKSLQFKAMYIMAQTIHYLKHYLEKDLDENSGARAGQLGARRDGDRLYMPGRLLQKNGSTINLVPIDFVAAQCVALMESSLEGDIFNIVNDRPNTLEEMLEYIGRFFNIDGLGVAPEKSFIEQPETALEKLGYSFIEVYRPYLCDTRVFENGKSARIGERHNITCPRLDFASFARCIDYAIKAEWGKAAKKDR
jgi:nucleoside-diphosphate-sugar epimerase